MNHDNANGSSPAQVGSSIRTDMRKASTTGLMKAAKRYAPFQKSIVISAIIVTDPKHTYSFSQSAKRENEMDQRLALNPPGDEEAVRRVREREM